MSRIVMGKTFQAADRSGWRRWLRQHHSAEDEVWLVFYRKGLGKPGIGYAEAAEEAICFGWVDGLKRRIDEERYAYRFTPRRPGSKWSPLNIRRAERMITENRMTDAGLRAFERRKTYDAAFLKQRARADISLDPEMETGLRQDPAAWANFKALAPSHRRQYAGWLNSAVKPETRQRRLEEATRLLKENRKLGMK
ncbi:MAG: YdeI/OmpD-associated family protein [Lysobacterales bacterium]|jgi:uncharacterized protein YdeI (YjbR/CyaY-like superfamily)